VFCCTGFRAVASGNIVARCTYGKRVTKVSIFSLYNWLMINQYTLYCIIIIIIVVVVMCIFWTEAAFYVLWLWSDVIVLSWMYIVLIDWLMAVINHESQKIDACSNSITLYWRCSVSIAAICQHFILKCGPIVVCSNFAKQ
jgi:hypothetical protein